MSPVCWCGRWPWVGEWVADRQLAAFRRQVANHGRTCDRGLWRYSRHPNYFFEWIHWWAYVVMAVGSPIGWLAWIGPVLMLFLLYRVTGIPYTEKRALASRGEGLPSLSAHHQSLYSVVSAPGKMLNAIDWAERGLLPDALIRWGHPPPQSRTPAGKSAVPTARPSRRPNAASSPRWTKHPLPCIRRVPTSSTTSCRPNFSNLVLGRHLKYR